MSTVNVNTIIDSYRSSVRSSDWFKEMTEGWGEPTNNNFFFEEEVNPNAVQCPECSTTNCGYDYNWTCGNPLPPRIRYCRKVYCDCNDDEDYDDRNYEEEPDYDISSWRYVDQKNMNEDTFLVKKFGKWEDDFKLASKKCRRIQLKEKFSSDLKSGEIRKTPYKKKGPKTKKGELLKNFI